ncbi:uncharacterized protein LOC143485760 [Brachyhypopomus gauderio]|uniref:uncharacterized protein LOC143485760 n=1 Tax=Brachyhypopomus gauderio TaxID=698409 RepID=UPI004042C5F4
MTANPMEERNILLVLKTPIWQFHLAQIQVDNRMKKTVALHKRSVLLLRMSVGLNITNAKDGTAWEKTDVVRIRGHASTTFTFSETAGPTEHAKRRITSRLQSFLCLIDIEMLRTITHCTVHEAHRADQSWNLSVSELMAFIAVLFLRAILCPVGAIADCWSKNYAVPAIKDTMSRDRYKEIMRYLRFDDKDTRAERVKSDRFAAISDIWQCFVRNCTLCYTPGQHITNDEQLFPTKVRCPFLQYIATKPDKFGIKFWIAADLKTKYMCNALPYLGKDSSRPKGERLSENVVMRLMEPYLDKGRTVTTDNYFTSLSLANRLLARNTALLGTINKIRREIHPPAKNTKGRKDNGEKTTTSTCSWKDDAVPGADTLQQESQLGAVCCVRQNGDVEGSREPAENVEEIPEEEIVSSMDNVGDSEHLSDDARDTPVEEKPSDVGNISDIIGDPEQEEAAYAGPDNIEEYDAGYTPPASDSEDGYTVEEAESPYVILLGSVEEYPTELFIQYMQAKDAVVFALEDLGFSERHGPAEALSAELHRSLFATIRLVQEFWRVIDHIYTR